MSNLSVRIHLDGEYISNIMYRNADMTVSIEATFPTFIGYVSLIERRRRGLCNTGRKAVR